MQHVRDRDSNGILAIISHPFDTYHAHSQPPVARIRGGRHVFIIVRIDCRYASVVDTGWRPICVHTYIYSCIPRKLPRRFPFLKCFLLGPDKKILNSTRSRYIIFFFFFPQKNVKIWRLLCVIIYLKYPEFFTRSQFHAL